MQTKPVTTTVVKVTELWIKPKKGDGGFKRQDDRLVWLDSMDSGKFGVLMKKDRDEAEQGNVSTVELTGLGEYAVKYERLNDKGHSIPKDRLFVYAFANGDDGVADLQDLQPFMKPRSKISGRHVKLADVNDVVQSLSFEELGRIHAGVRTRERDGVFGALSQSGDAGATSVDDQAGPSQAVPSRAGPSHSTGAGDGDSDNSNSATRGRSAW